MNGVDLTQSLKDAWAAVVAFAPKVLLAVIFLVVGFLVARVLARVLDLILKRVGFDRLVERGEVKRVLSRTQYSASSLLAKLVYYALLVVVLQLTFGVFGPNPVSALLSNLVAFLPKVFAALLIMMVAAAVGAVVKDLLQGLLAGLGYGRLLAGLTGAFILATGCFAALSQLSIAPAIVNALYYALLAVVAGSAIVAIGGGGIAPMRARWEKLLDRMEQEATPVRPGASPSAPELVAPRPEVWPQGPENGPKKN